MISLSLSLLREGEECVLYCWYDAADGGDGAWPIVRGIVLKFRMPLITRPSSLFASTLSCSTWHEDSNGAAASSSSSSTSSTTSLNSEGLPNNGIDYYINPQTIRETMAGCTNRKPYMVSISGKTLNDNLQMLQKIYKAIHEQQQQHDANPGDDEKINIAAVELNLACPNIIGKPTIGYDFEQMEDVLKRVSSLPCFGTTSPPLFPLGVKLPPYFDRSHFIMAATILNKYKHILTYVATINTIGNALAVDYHAEMKAVRPNGGYAGLSGPAVKYTALANVCMMRELLDESIDVVGVGGVQTGKDAFEMILCGAHAVQVGTCHWLEGPGCFDRICRELRLIMKEKGYTKIEDFRGKLKEWSKEGATLSREARMSERRKEGVVESGGGKQNNMSMMSDGYHSLFIAVLFVVIAVLLADKYQIVSL